MSIHIVKVNGLKGDARKGICYVGRAFAGWPESLWGNPFKAAVKQEPLISMCLKRFRTHAENQPPEYLASLWEACKQGTLPLGCWCINATHDDGQPIVCHGQILASMLHDRFVKPANTVGTEHEPEA